MKKEDLTIFEYRLSKEIKYTDLVKREKALGRAEKISFFAEETGYIDGYVYRPSEAKDEALPVIFNFHGGGMVLKYCEQDGEYCQRMADQTGSAVVNVDYPVAPEYKFPVPVNATYSFLVQVMKNAERLGLRKGAVQLLGHSAGGYLSAALCVLNNREKELDIASAALNYPLLRWDRDPAVKQAKDPEKAIDSSRMAQYFSWYFEDPEDAETAEASPYLADSSLFPAMLVNGAEYDSLCMEEKQFVHKLEDAGVKAEFYLYPECMHGFTHSCFGEYDPEGSQLAWERCASFLKENR